MTVEERLARLRVVPVIAIDRAADIVPLCEALRRAELLCAEITFRTEEGKEALEIAVSRFPDFVIGAGTVTRPEEVDAAALAGAAFAVAPGTNARIVEHAARKRLPFFPGVATPSEIETALELGCRTVKFFPAESLGGVSMLKAMFGPYRHRGLRVIPTGGVSAANMPDYLAQPEVVAVGGSWMVAPSLVEAGDWQTIEALAREAVRASRTTND